ncbi:ATP-binding cassette domain-containing protein [Aquimarina pacifica]|uniref:ATP-binding cassette domain-containing protein n=1 Tax=Aquimarina pacifica TaxID=1296415 RepID=UPI0004721E8B|nr:ABC transporter ATP-binding protein [Aquimarina pacifica]
MIFNKTIKRFFKEYTTENRHILIYALLFSIFQSVLLLPSVYLIKLIFDNNIPNQDLQGLLINSGSIIALTLLQSLLSIIHRNIFLKITKNAVLRLQKELLTSIIKAKKVFFDKTDQAKLVDRTVSDIETVDMMIDGLLSIIIPQITLFCIGVGIMVIYNPVIGLTTLALGIIGVLFQQKLRKSTLQSIRQYNLTKDTLSSYVNHLSHKHVLIKMRNLESLETVEASQYSSTMTDQGTDAAKKGWNSKVINELIINISATLLIVLGSVQILLGIYSYGNIFGLYFLIVFIRRTATLIQSQWSTMNLGTIALEKIYDLHDSSIIKTSNKTPLHIDFSGNITLKNITFEYQKEQRLLNHIDFDIKRGETVLITGANGSGKSSLINLILGFYSPLSGEIFAENTSYDSIDLGELRSKIGYIPQQQVLVNGTIRQNLMFGVSSPNFLEKLKSSPIFIELIKEFQNGLETQIIQGGKNLSSGQVQRISILRALITNPELLIMDEPTNHLDSTSIISMVKTIKKQKDISIIIISHHSLFKDLADKTYYLSRGNLSLIK